MAANVSSSVDEEDRRLDESLISAGRRRVHGLNLSEHSLTSAPVELRTLHFVFCLSLGLPNDVGMRPARLEQLERRQCAKRGKA